GAPSGDASGLERLQRHPGRERADDQRTRWTEVGPCWIAPFLLSQQRAGLPLRMGGSDPITTLGESDEAYPSASGGYVKTLRADGSEQGTSLMNYVVPVASAPCSGPGRYAPVSNPAAPAAACIPWMSSSHEDSLSPSFTHPRELELLSGLIC